MRMPSLDVLVRSLIRDAHQYTWFTLSLLVLPKKFIKRKEAVARGVLLQMWPLTALWRW